MMVHFTYVGKYDGTIYVCRQAAHHTSDAIAEEEVCHAVRTLQQCSITGMYVAHGSLGRNECRYGLLHFDEMNGGFSDMED
jgi:hypothetical protein